MIDQQHQAYALRVYGSPAGADELHDAEQLAIESGRAHLRARARPAFAEVKHRLTSRAIWTGYLEADGSIAESYDREPGSD